MPQEVVSNSVRLSLFWFLIWLERLQRMARSVSGRQLPERHMACGKGRLIKTNDGRLHDKLYMFLCIVEFLA